MVKDQIKKYLPKIYLMTNELSVPLFSTPWGMRASQIILSVFSILFIVTFIQTFYTWHADGVSARINNSGIENAGDTLLAAIKQIPQAHLFGSNIASQGFVPITSLQLHLVGITKTNNDATSRVIISESGSPGKIYAIGDSLPSGIRVYAINNDGVVFENSGHLEKLPLVRQRLEFAGAPKSMWSGEQ